MQIIKKKVIRSSVAMLLALQLACSSSTAIFAQTTQPPVSDSAYTEQVTQDSRYIEFNDEWRFSLSDPQGAQDKSYDDSAWRQLTLPHDWSIELDFNKNSPGGGGAGFLDGGTGWYRKSFVLDESMKNKEISIDFGGVYMDSTVYVNGTYIGNYPNGYTPFAYDIADQLICDGVTENVIAVKVVNRQPSSRWYSGSGIYRNVNLTVTNPVHVDRYGTFVTTPDLEAQYSSGSAKVDIKTKVENSLTTEAGAAVRATVYDMDGNKVGEALSPVQQCAADSVTEFSQQIQVANPQLWDNDNPNIYNVKTEVLINESVVDTYHTDFGFRWYKLDPNKGFSLNGQSMKLQGVCMHHDQGAMGAVANYRSIERQMEIMKDMGVNAIRVTHNPAADELIEICNKMGLMVIDEAFDAWEYNKRQYDYARFFNKAATHPDAKQNMTWAEYDIKQMVERGKNDPSIIMWSLGNEIVGASVGTATKLNNWVKEIDTTRPTTQGYNTFIGQGAFRPDSNEAKVADVSDIPGFNYGEENYNIAHESYPEWPILGTETSSATRSRGIYAHPGQEHVAGQHPDKQQSSYDVDRVGWGKTMQNAWKAYRDREYIAGEFMWTGFDYIGEPTPYYDQWPSKSSYFGAVDTAGFPKDAFYMYQSVWFSAEEKPMVHMLPHWNWDEGENVVMNVYSNAPKVELFLDDTSLGEQSFIQKTTNYGKPYQEDEKGNIFLTWIVPFQAGTLKAVAKDLQGNVIATDIVSTAGQPAKVKLTPDRNVITADGKDLSYITVDIQDEKGNFVPTADNLVNFQISGNGKIVGVDNGNAIAVDERYKDNKRKAFSGKALVIVQSTKDAGSFTLTATSLGLSSDKITGFTVAPEDSDKKVLLGYEEASVKTIVGEEVTLPETVTAVYSIGEKENMEVNWDSIPDGSTDKPGSFPLEGTVTKTGDRVALTVNVVGILGVKDYHTVTPLNVIPQMPDTVQVVYSDGSHQSRDVTWERELTTEDVAVEQTVYLTGTVDGVPDYQAKAAVRVKYELELMDISTNKSGSGFPKAIKSYEQGADYARNINDANFDGASRWTNWTSNGSRRNDWIGVEFEQEQKVDSIDIWMFINNDCLVPDTTVVEYWNGSEWIAVENQDKIKAADFTADRNKNSIHFDSVITKKIRLNVTTSKLNTGYIEIIVNGYSSTPTATPDTDASLAGISLDGQPIEEFAANKMSYERELNYADSMPTVTATLPKGSNASVFVVPALDKDGMATIEVTAEDGKTTQIYSVKFNMLPPTLEAVTISASATTITEDDVIPITVDALLENGEKINNETAEISYKVIDGTGHIEVQNGSVYAYDAGTASVQVTVTHQGISVESNVINFTIAKNTALKTITAYESLTVETGKNVKPQLPQKVKATYDIGLPRMVEITWDKIPQDKYASYGEFVVEGTALGQSLKAKVKVIVKGILGIQSFSTSTPIGNAPVLPDKASVYYSDGKTDDLAVTWDSYDRELLKTEQIFTVNGTVTGTDGTSYQTSISIRVSEDTIKGDNYLGYKNGFYWPVAMASFTNMAGQDKVEYLNDNIISHDRIGNVNRWTNWISTGRAEDWVGIILGKEIAEKKFLDNLEVDFYFDDGGTELPADYQIQYFVGDSIDTPRDPSVLSKIPADHMLNDDVNWADVPNLVKPVSLTEKGTTYFTFDTVETFAIRIKMTSKPGKCLGITEIKGYEKLTEKYDSFTVGGITVGGQPLEGFDQNILTYNVAIPAGSVPEITATADNNAAVDVIAAKDGNDTAKVIVTAENGVAAKTYQIKFTQKSEPLKTEILEHVIELAQLAKENGALDGVIDIVKENFEKALAAANTVYADAISANPTVTQADIDTAWVNLMDAMHYLEFKGDKTTLIKAVELAAIFEANKGKYIPSTYAPFEVALVAARAVVADGNALNDEINSTWRTLVQTMAGLRLIPNKDALNDLKAQAEAVDTSKYTAASVAVMRSALSDAVVVLNNVEATQEMVDSTEEALRNALAGLEPITADHNDSGSGEAISGTGTNKAGSANNTKTSDNAPIALKIVLVAMSGLALFAIKKKKK